MRKIVVLMTLMKLDIGGAETHVIELCKSLQKKGVKVIVASYGGVYLEELQKHNITHYTAPLHKKDPISFIKNYKILVDIIKKENVHILHCHTRISSLIGNFISKRNKNIIFVSTAHATFSTRFLFRKLTRWGEHTIAVSNDIKNYLLKNYNISNENITVTVNGINTNKFSKNIDYSDILQEFSLDKDTFKILCVSRLEETTIKHIVELISITSDLVNINNNIKIIIVGGGDAYKKVKSLAQSKNAELGKNVITLTDARIDVNKFLAMSDILVGVSRAALEAMATELPVVVSGSEGYIGIFNESKLQDALNTNFCCRNLEVTTKEKLKKDIEFLMTCSKEKRISLGEYGHKVVLNHYSTDKMANDNLNIYKKVLKNKYANKKIDVLVSGYHGFINNGDDATLQSLVLGLREKDSKIKIVVLSKNPAITKSQFDVDAINRYNIFKIIKTMKKTNTLVTGGGTLFQDATSTRNIHYYGFITTLAKKYGLKTMLYGNGIGPITKQSNKNYTKKVLNQVDVITLRDKDSLDTLETLDINQPLTYLKADPALTLKKKCNKSCEEILQKYNIQKDTKYFIVALRPWKHCVKNFENILDDIVKYTFENYNTIPVFLPMHNPNDIEISKRLHMKNPNSILINVNYTTDDVLTLIGNATFVLGMRLHSIIYALKENTPVIALNYDPKVSGVMSMANQKLIVNVENTNFEEIKNHIDDLQTRKETIIEEINTSTKIMKSLAKENIDIVFDVVKGY